MRINKFLITLSLIPIIMLGLIGLSSSFVAFLMGFCDFAEFLGLCLNISPTLGVYSGLFYNFLKNHSNGFGPSQQINGTLVWFYFGVIFLCCLGVLMGIYLIILGVGFKSEFESQVYFLFLDFTIGGFSGKLIYDAFSLESSN